MKKNIRRITIILILLLISLSLSSCAYNGYYGDYRGAYTLIYSQVPDILGARDHGLFLVNPQIVLVESDDYGRGLYLYLEDTEEVLSIGIVQTERDNNVYFYPEQSTLSFKLPDRIYDIDNKDISKEELLSLMNQLCSFDKMIKFKALNDWNTPLNYEKMESAKISSPIIPLRWGSREDIVNLLDYKWVEEVFRIAIKNGHEPGEDYRYFSHENWMATDDYGRRLYYVEAYYYIYFNNSKDINYITYYLEMIAIINPDRSYNPDTFMVELEGKTNYHEQIKDLKLANGWNQPL